MPTVNQLVSLTRNFHALVLIITCGIFFGTSMLLGYWSDHTAFIPNGQKDNLLMAATGCLLMLFFIYLISQAFDLSLKINYNAMAPDKKTPLFNFRHGWRATLINSIYFLSTITLGALAFAIMQLINSRTFDFSTSALNDPDYYYYDKSEIQQFFDGHSGAALLAAFLLLVLVSMTTAVFSGTNAQISYENKSGLESAIRALRRLNSKTWAALTVLRFIYMLIVIAIGYFGYMIVDYFGQFGQYAGPGIALVGFYFLYPYVVSLHTGFYYRYANIKEEEKEAI